MIFVPKLFWSNFAPKNGYALAVAVIVSLLTITEMDVLNEIDNVTSRVSFPPIPSNPPWLPANGYPRKIQVFSVGFLHSLKTC